MEKNPTSRKARLVQQRDAFFNGRKDETGKTIDRGVIAIRGPKSAEQIKTTMERLQVAHAQRS